MIADKFGAKDQLSMELARLHSRAVDSAKTGDEVIVPPYIREKANKWPHFMGRPENLSYHSTSILVIFDFLFF